jgi:hypothetical protein
VFQFLDNVRHIYFIQTIHYECFGKTYTVSVTVVVTVSTVRVTGGRGGFVVDEVVITVMATVIGVEVVKRNVLVRVAVVVMVAVEICRRDEQNKEALDSFCNADTTRPTTLHCTLSRFRVSWEIALTDTPKRSNLENNIEVDCLLTRHSGEDDRRMNCRMLRLYIPSSDPCVFPMYQYVIISRCILRLDSRLKRKPKLHTGCCNRIWKLARSSKELIEPRDSIN